ncbi:MAG: LamG-like jellyroll fold domain-containing protein [Planctomycetota bacterium]
MDERTNKLIHELIHKSLDGEISADEIQRLKDFVCKPENVPYYLGCLRLETALRTKANLFGASGSHLSDIDFGLEALALYEKTAPAIEIPKEQPQRELIQKVVYPPREKRKISKFNLFTLITSAAAILFFVLFVKFAPSPSDAIVARLGNSVQARWADTGQPIESGSDLSAGSLKLIGGYAEIIMDDGAVVVLEAPVKIELEGPDQLYLASGSLVAQVPPRAIGFTVRSPDATIVDYGTNFGVQVDSAGTTQAHVFAGQVEMRSGSDTRVFEKALRLIAGQAAQVKNADIQVTAYKPEVFVAGLPLQYDQRVRELEPSVAWRKKPKEKYKEPIFDTFVPFHVQTKGNEKVDFSEDISLPGLRGYRAAQLNGQNRLRVKIPLRTCEQVDPSAFTTVVWLKAARIQPCDLMTQFIHQAAADRDQRRYRTLSLDADGAVIYAAVEAHVSDRPTSIRSQKRIQPNQWYQVALSGGAGKQTRLYINGQFQGAFSEVSPYGELYNVTYLGGMPLWREEDLAKGFSGQTGEMLFFDRQLSAMDIRGLYQSALQQ